MSVATSVRLVRSCLSVCALMGMLLGAPPARAATPQDVGKAIKKGVEWLYGQQNEDGNWDFILKPDANGKFAGDVKQACGPTAMAVYALLTAGEDPKDPRIVKAVDFLKRTQTQGTYAMGFRANAYALMPVSDDIKRALAADATWLKNSMRLGKDVKVRGFYGYGAGPRSGLDRSTSQIAVLGAWGCAQVGDSLGEDYWKIIEGAWRKAQLEDGGWNYSDGFNSAPSVAMTAGGVATLFITQEYLHANDFSECKGSVVDPNIEKGVKYLGDNLQNALGAWPYYTLYAVERCGAASGYKFFGTSNWFEFGADWIVKQQAEDGSWDGKNNFNTSFAILFLARGRSPIAVNKLQYGVDDVSETKGQAATVGNWNQRPRDVPNILRWAGRQQERALNFQIVNIETAAEELQDAPILYISGNQPLNFSAEKTAKLKKFVEEGGLIVGNADCSNKPFAESFRKLGQKMFPAYEFRVLPADHVMYTAEQFPAKAWKNQPNLMALGNGAREFMLLFGSGDPSKYWQMHMLGGHEEMHQAMADILSYAVERDSTRHKGETHLVKADPMIQAERTMKLARLEYPGNWDPEPGAWRRMGAILHNEQKIDLTIVPVKLGEGKLDNTYAIAHLTGTAGCKLSKEAKDELKKYVEGGGTLLVDACGGSSAFATDIEPELATLFAGGKAALEVLPLEHKIYATDFMSEPKITEVGYRPFAKKVVGQEIKIPQLRGVEIGGRAAVLFSREDLSAGMVGEPVDGILGYSPKSTAAIVQHILLLNAPKLEPKPEAKPAGT